MTEFLHEESGHSKAVLIGASKRPIRTAQQ